MSSSSAKSAAAAAASWVEWASLGDGRRQTEVARLTSSALGEAVFDSDPAVFTWLSEATADGKQGALVLASVRRRRWLTENWATQTARSKVKAKITGSDTAVTLAAQKRCSS